MRKSLTWDHGSEMAKHAALTLAITMPVYFAHPRSSWKRGTNENANALVRVHLPKSTRPPAPGPRPVVVGRSRNFAELLPGSA